LHLSGSVRLAALKYYPEFLEASAGLERLDFHTSPARHAVSWHRESSRDLIREAHNSFDKITTNFNMKTRTRSGILYRVERSRYYVKQFEESVPALKLSALDGYQKYDDFVKRRLGPAFDFIDRLGGRYERAINSLAALDQYYLSIQSVEFNEVIQEIQRDGELILLLFPVPYYFSMLLEHTLIKPAAEVGTIIIWICSVALAFGRRTSKKSESESSLNGIIEAVRLGSFRKIWASIYARRRPIIVFFSTVIAFGGMSAGFYGAKLCGLLKLQENSVYEESEHPTFCRYVRPDSNDDVTTHVQCDRDGVKNFVTDVPICNNYAGDIGAAQRARNYMQMQRR
jgi:hypothetical protein